MNNKKIVCTQPWVVETINDSFNEKITHPYDIIVRNKYSHLSAGTELACVSGTEDWFVLPDVPGYTSIGELIAKGDAVTHVEKGDLIYTFGPHQEYFKLNLQDRFHGVCLKVPSDLSPDVASFSRMCSIALTALRKSNIEIGDTVIVSGQGAIGNLVAQFAQLQGAKVFALDINSKRLSISKQCGIHNIVMSDASKMDEVMYELLDGKKVDAWIDATGRSAVINDAVNYITNKGEMILLGSPRSTFETDITPLLRKIHLIENIQLKGALEFLYPTWPNDFEKHSIERNTRIIFDLMREGKLIIHPLYSHKLKPEDALEAYLGLRDDADKYIGVVFEW
jgi:2-desacetyl-2-hydroxyethyl bacteriochlorophyllide A dehydrogenase